MEATENKLEEAICLHIAAQFSDHMKLAERMQVEAPAVEVEFGITRQERRDPDVRWQMFFIHSNGELPYSYQHDYYEINEVLRGRKMYDTLKFKPENLK